MVSGKLWKDLRKGLTPAFTSGRLKSMMAPMEGEIEKFLSHIERLSEQNEDVDVKTYFQGMKAELKRFLLNV